METDYSRAYIDREQSLIKHHVLDKYLERFARIVGKAYEGILYVDGFSGPWNLGSNDFSDSSFAIALKQLRAARETVRAIHNKDLSLKCIFLEKDPIAFAELQAYAKAQEDVEVIALNRDFEQAVPELETLIRKTSKGYFPFIFIDPKGWKGFSMDLISPLIKHRPCELLVNFMTGFILRFIEDERAGIEASFQKLFGKGNYKDELKHLEGREREDAVVFSYAKRIAEVGGFDYVPISIVQNPTKDRTHFHLVYATRNILGVEVFKEAERKALDLTVKVRGDAKRRKREALTGQSEFFGGTEIPETAYTQELLEHYSRLAREEVQRFLRSKGEVAYDELYAIGMGFPIVQETELRDWISEIAEVVNLGLREKVPKLRCGHRVRLRPA